jgi:CheY-like chemotaxis protein
MNTSDHETIRHHELKRQLRQLESIAALSGGIAHDYNNLLTAIIGNISLALEHATADSRLSNLLSQALAASRMAKELTRTLITFSKGGQPSKHPTDVVRLVKDTAGFSLSGSTIGCAFGPSDDIWRAFADARQIGQAIHHLLVNAAESMPSGGIVSIRFDNVGLDSPDNSLLPGRYVDITIQDHGTGIHDDHIDKIFDPYFSTKPKGGDRGAGLGLSISQSIIANHGGHISVHSRRGEGSTVHVRLPAYDGAADAVPPVCEARSPTISAQPVHGRGKILVMDDEAMIRELADNILSHLGYEADFSAEGESALRKYEAALTAGRPYDAVILDLTIKGGMGGLETMRLLKSVDPEVKAIVSSGYSDDPVIADFHRYGFCEVVAKPYEMVEFSQKLHRVVNLPASN